jgi:hypothetical protein
MPLEERVEYGTARQEVSQLEDYTVDKGENLLKIDLACGQKKKEGYKGIDQANIEGVDYVHNLMEFPWPFDIFLFSY